MDASPANSPVKLTVRLIQCAVQARNEPLADISAIPAHGTLAQADLPREPILFHQVVETGTPEASGLPFWQAAAVLNPTGGDDAS